MSGIGSKKNLMKSLALADRIRLVSFTTREISLKRQCELVEVNRSSVYRKYNQEQTNLGHGESQENLDIMRIIDQAHLEHPS